MSANTDAANNRKPWAGFKPGTKAEKRRLLPDGVYVGQLVSISERVFQNGGKTCQLNYEVIGDHDGLKYYLNELADPNPVFSSKFCKRLAAANGVAKFEEGTALDDVAYAGPVLISVIHTVSDDGDAYNRVDNVMPCPKAYLRAGVPSRVAAPAERLEAEPIPGLNAPADLVPNESEDVPF